MYKPLPWSIVSIRDHKTGRWVSAEKLSISNHITSSLVYRNVYSGTKKTLHKVSSVRDVFGFMKCYFSADVHLSVLNDLPKKY